MKVYLFLALLAVAGCSKKNDSLKAIPKATDNGSYKIALDGSSSSGPIDKWGWQLDINTVTTSPVTYSPKSNSDNAAFFPITATVTKAGTYTFGLTVYDKSGNLDYQLVTVEVK